MKVSKEDKTVAIALRVAAQIAMEFKDKISLDEARRIDRGLRSCKGIDIDTIWVRWRYVGYPMGWLTHDELQWDQKRKKYVYADNVVSEE